MIWLGWAILLIAQNFAFTMVSRARNSGSLSYHAICAVFSNGIWIFSQTIVISLLLEALATGSAIYIAKVGIFYTIFTVTGSLAAHKFARTVVEKGKRKVGA